jgi:hypothetical protein
LQPHRRRRACSVQPLPFQLIFIVEPILLRSGLTGRRLYLNTRLGTRLRWLAGLLSRGLAGLHRRIIQRAITQRGIAIVQGGITERGIARVDVVTLGLAHSRLERRTGVVRLATGQHYPSGTQQCQCYNLLHSVSSF